MREDREKGHTHLRWKDEKSIAMFIVYLYE